MLVGGFIAAFVGLMGLFFVVMSLLSGMNERGDWMGVCMGSCFLSLAFGFGRVAVAAITEKSAHPIDEGSAKPYAVAMAFMVLGFLILIGSAMVLDDGPSY